MQRSGPIHSPPILHRQFWRSVLCSGLSRNPFRAVCLSTDQGHATLPSRRRPRQDLSESSATSLSSTPTGMPITKPQRPAQSSRRPSLPTHFRGGSGLEIVRKCNVGVLTTLNHIKEHGASTHASARRPTAYNIEHRKANVILSAPVD